MFVRFICDDEVYSFPPRRRSRMSRTTLMFVQYERHTVSPRGVTASVRSICNGRAFFIPLPIGLTVSRWPILARLMVGDLFPSGERSPSGPSAGAFSCGHDIVTAALFFFVSSYFFFFQYLSHPIINISATQLRCRHINDHLFIRSVIYW